MTMDIEQLRVLAARIRRAFELYAGNTPDPMFEGFPRATCGPTAELIARYLREVCGLDAQCVEAHCPDGWTHAWVVVGDIIVDITADQFAQAPVIVTRDSPWHGKWEADDPRPPNCTRKQWPMYPEEAWKALVAAMSA
jgi:hypothetical protein